MSDPIVHLVMRRDGLTPESVWAVIQAASVKLQEKPKEVADIECRSCGLWRYGFEGVVGVLA